MKCISKKVILFIMIGTMMFNCFAPVTVMALSTDFFNIDKTKTDSYGDSLSINTDTKSKTSILREITDKREKNIKHFLKNDGTYEAVVYPSSVHYFKNGKYLDINNSLSSNNGYYSNKENDYKIKLANKINNGYLVNITKDKYQLSYNLDNANKVKGEIITQDLSYLDELTADEKIKTLTDLYSGVVYKKVFTNTDLSYDITPDSVKEKIVLDQYNNIESYTFTIDTKNLVAQIMESEITFKDSSTGEIVFNFQKPYMYDKNDEISYDIDIDLKELKTGYKLTITPDKEWLKSADRSYPVVIDPTVVTNIGTTAILDNHVSSAYPTTNYINSYLIKTGYGSASKINRTYIKFTLPTLKSSDMVTYAELNLSLTATNTLRNQVNVHKVLSDWSTYIINWNNKPAYDTNIVDYKRSYGNNMSYQKWDVTSIAKEWYTTQANYGLMIKAVDETTAYTDYYSSDTSGTYAPYRPFVTIQYTNNNGLEDYWTYHSQDAGRAGTGYVNDYNGNLVFVHDDYATSGERLPIAIKHVFNSNDRSINANYGYGFRLNYNQSISYTAISGIGYYVYKDEDGTDHYLKDQGSGIYKDELGLDITLTVNATNPEGKYIIADKYSNKLVFDNTSLKLIKVKDNRGNIATINYTNGLISSIVDGGGKITTLNYLNAFLTSIVTPDNKTYSYWYDASNRLIKIVYPDTKYVTYTYNTNNNMIRANNIDNNGIEYQYSTVAPYRINKVLEKYIGTITKPGLYLDLAYSFNSTKFTDYKGNYSNYQFNNMGETILIKDNFGNAEYYKYGSGSNMTKMQVESDLQETIANKLYNHNFESGDAFWSLVNLDGSVATGAYTTEAKNIGSQSYKIIKSNNVGESVVRQQLTTRTGKTYTLSMYGKTKNVTSTNNGGIRISVQYTDGSGVIQKVYSDVKSKTDNWERFDVTFTLPSNASSTIYVQGGLVNETGTVYFDNAQLEEDQVANRYNIIENSDFNFYDAAFLPSFDTKTGTINAADKVVAFESGVSQLSGSTYLINGSSFYQKGLSQTVKVSGVAGDTFIYGAWAKGNSASLVRNNDETRLFGIRVTINNTDGSTQTSYTSFNQNTADWQYISDVIIAPKVYSSVKYEIVYNCNTGVAYFDGLQLYRESFGNTYSYDSSGNIVSAKSSLNTSNSYAYTNNDLTKLTTAENNAYNYEYTANHLLTKMTSPTNVVSSFTYDGNNNLVKSKVSGGSIFIESSLEYDSTGSYVTKEIDARNNEIVYYYNNSNGNLNSYKNANDVSTSYTYDSLGSVISTTKDNKTVNYSYTNDKLSQISSDGITYDFLYDDLGHQTNIKVNDITLVTKNYQVYNGINTHRLDSITYGNNNSIVSTYDSLDRVIALTVDGIQRFQYKYDGSSNLIKSVDIINNITTIYFYDSLGRLIKISRSNGEDATFIYNTFDKIEQIIERYQDSYYSTSYQYDSENRINNVYFAQLPNSYDAESFPLVNNLYGLKGTKPIDQSAVFSSDEQGNKVYSPNGTNSLAKYNLSVSNTSGTFGTWIKTTVSDINRTIIANSDILKLYINANNKLVVSVKNTSGIINDVVVSDSGISSDNWYFVGYKWSTVGTDTTITIFLNNDTYTGTISNMVDINNSDTYIGTEVSSNNPLTGYMNNLLYSDTLLNDTVITSIYNMGRGENVKYSYDSIGRISSKTLYTFNMTKIDNYNYLEGYNGSSTTLLASINEVIKDKDSNTLTNITTLYTYDDLNNISSITYNNGTVISYTYDNLNQLKTETNSSTNIKTTYSYSGIGNISEVLTEDITDIDNPVLIDTKTYLYNTTWQDQLVSYDGYNIIYDSVGNPLTIQKDNITYYSYVFEKGRQLKSLYVYNGYKSENDLNISYTYNDEGIRLSKTVTDAITNNSVVTKYTIADNKILYETNGTDKIHYIYDAGSNLIGLTVNDKTYYYERNVTNDIIGIVDENGNRIVTYEYDSYGKLLNMTDTSNSNIGIKNPFRYKGYYYDNESGYYYLNARYYNPDMKRFINADDEGVLELDQGNILENNMYTYALNNPIMYIDESGNISALAILGLVAAGALDAYTIYEAVKNPTAGNIFFAVTVPIGGGIVAVKCIPKVVKYGIGTLKGIKMFKKTNKSFNYSREYLLKKVSNQKLRNVVDELYRPGAKIGDGSTADALRYEIKTGILVGEKSHYQKAIERIKNLERILVKENLNSTDRKIAQNILNDMKAALNGN